MAELALAAIAVLVLLSWLLLAIAGVRRLRQRQRPLAVLDGSNVMHWKDGKPQIDTVIGVLRLLDRLGYESGVVFDANAGYLLADRYMNADEFRKQLGLTGSRVLVVPKGEQADPFLLRFASKSNAVIVSNDRFRDRIADFPLMAGPGRLVRGGCRQDGLWLDLPAAANPARKPGRRAAQ
ncbi:NYN domain-containing protein [Pseudogemmobacter bohemicus]|uniref:NYN domain-containing protein n=1 Tax=Pseudogemmobacter bohemicus TaxID=2250708 RepID=UPI000DD2EE6E|nr:hypothetical protein [Pseudogemmobacter bohemicus]